jgi:hypothetical protein
VQAGLRGDPAPPKEFAPEGRDRAATSAGAREAIERLKLVKKFQGVGCSLAELKGILQDRDTHTRTNQEVIEWICHKIREIERRKDGLNQMLGTLHWMLTTGGQ